jgi:multiple sugar transport system permease protein
MLSLALNRRIEYAWLADPHWALLSIIVAEVWQWTPLMFLLILTAFVNVPRNQWRAALGLGATPVRAFFSIVLPLSLPVMLVAVLIRAIETGCDRTFTCGASPQSAVSNNRAFPSPKWF